MKDYTTKNIVWEQREAVLEAKYNGQRLIFIGQDSKGLKYGYEIIWPFEGMEVIDMCVYDLCRYMRENF